MMISRSDITCDRVAVMNCLAHALMSLVGASVLAAGSLPAAEATNAPAGTNASASANAAPAKGNESPATRAASPRDESSFKIIAERNIFNANRSGGRVTVASSRRPTRIDSFALVGTMAYQKGAFAFFEGSSSEFSKVLQANGVIAGHKIVDVLADGVMLEADGKQFELPVGSQMRREDTGPWHLATGGTGGSGNGSSYAAVSSNGESSNPSSRSSRTESGRSRRTESSDTGSRPATSPTPTASTADQNEVLKRLMERREKE